MRFEIWHARNPTFGSGSDPKFPDEMILIGHVEAEDEEHAFRLTNSIDRPWVKNKEVRLAEGVHDARSFSVGDVFVTENGTQLRCKFFGFQECCKLFGFEEV